MFRSGPARLLLFVLALSVLATGCIKRESTTRIKADGSGTNELILAFNFDFHQWATARGAELQSVDDIHGTIAKQLEDVQKAMPEEWQGTAEPWSDGSHVGARLTARFQDTKVLGEQLKIFCGVGHPEAAIARSVRFTNDGDTGRISMDGEIVSGAWGMKELDGIVLPAEWHPRAIWRIEFPNGIDAAESDLGEIGTIDGNAVVFRIPGGVGRDQSWSVKVVGNPPPDPTLLIAGIVGGVWLLGALIFGLRRAASLKDTIRNARHDERSAIRLAMSPPVDNRKLGMVAAACVVAFVIGGLGLSMKWMTWTVGSDAGEMAAFAEAMAGPANEAVQPWLFGDGSLAMIGMLIALGGILFSMPARRLPMASLIVGGLIAAAVSGYWMANIATAPGAGGLAMSLTAAIPLTLGAGLILMAAGVGAAMLRVVSRKDAPRTREEATIHVRKINPELAAAAVQPGMAGQVTNMIHNQQAIARGEAMLAEMAADYDPDKHRDEDRARFRSLYEEYTLSQRQPVPPQEEVISDDDRAAVASLKDAHAKIIGEMQKAIVGQERVIDELLISIFARGHCLLIGVPGLAKTLMIRTLSDALSLSFSRIQFTPDLMPSDITGTEVMQEDKVTGGRAFKFVPGPIFASVILADEINRTPPKTQASLLEAMQEFQVTAGGQRHELPQPFFVLATQNPIEQEGTYPLPEAQQDRFMFNIHVDYPDEAEEVEIVTRTTRPWKPDLEKVLSGEEILNLQQIVRRAVVPDPVIKYANGLTRATRPMEDVAPSFVKKWVAWGAGPRAGQYLLLGAKANAILQGRMKVTADDVRNVAHPVLRHRIICNFTADADQITSDDVVTRLLDVVPAPDSREPAAAAAAN